MKITTVAVCSIVSFFVLATPRPLRQYTPEQKAEQREKVLQHTGGLIEKPGEGTFVIMNTQNAIGRQWIEEQAALLKSIAHVEVKVQTGGDFVLADMSKVMSVANAKMLLYIVDNQQLPMSLTAIEAGWAVLNVASYKADSPSEGKLKLRFQREFVRISGVLGGGCCSQYKGGVMHPVRTITDLDSLLSEKYTFDFVQAMAKNMPKYGITQFRRVIYKKAVEEGWAPAPTNDFQRMVLERVKAEKERGPSNPLQIKP